MIRIYNQLEWDPNVPAQQPIATFTDDHEIKVLQSGCILIKKPDLTEVPELGQDGPIAAIPSQTIAAFQAGVYVIRETDNV